MGATTRRDWIVGRLFAQGSVTIVEVVEAFDVSRMTVHRDLDELASEGLARKVRGGATVLPSTLYESDVRFRIGQRSEAKRTLCATAARWLEPGAAVLVDEATTTLPLLDHLTELGPCTVLTNFREMLNRLAQARSPEIEVLALGGRYHPRFDSYTGPLCAAQLEGIHADLYVTSTTAVADGAAWHPDADIAAVKRAMIDASTTSLLLMDRSKISQRGLHRVAELRRFDAVIIEDGTPDDTVDRLDAAGVAVHVAHADDEQVDDGSR